MQQSIDDWFNTINGVLMLDFLKTLCNGVFPAWSKNTRRRLISKAYPNTGSLDNRKSFVMTGRYDSVYTACIFFRVNITLLKSIRDYKSSIRLPNRSLGMLLQYFFIHDNYAV